MKLLAFALAAVVSTFGALGCVEAYPPPPVHPVTGSVRYCDDYGCRTVYAPYFYSNGEVVYWDAQFGIWVGRHRYWRGGRWYHGFHPGYFSHHYGHRR
jgi:hypothetical protein